MSLFCMLLACIQAAQSSDPRSEGTYGIASPNSSQQDGGSNAAGFNRAGPSSSVNELDLHWSLVQGCRNQGRFLNIAAGTLAAVVGSNNILYRQRLLLKLCIDSCREVGLEEAGGQCVRPEVRQDSLVLQAAAIIDSHKHVTRVAFAMRIAQHLQVPVEEVGIAIVTDSNADVPTSLHLQELELSCLPRVNASGHTVVSDTYTFNSQTTSGDLLGQRMTKPAHRLPGYSFGGYIVVRVETRRLQTEERRVQQLFAASNLSEILGLPVISALPSTLRETKSTMCYGIHRKSQAPILRIRTNITRNMSSMFVWMSETSMNSSHPKASALPCTPCSSGRHAPRECSHDANAGQWDVECWQYVDSVGWWQHTDGRRLTAQLNFAGQGEPWEVSEEAIVQGKLTITGEIQTASLAKFNSIVSAALSQATNVTLVLFPHTYSTVNPTTASSVPRIQIVYPFSKLPPRGTANQVLAKLVQEGNGNPPLFVARLNSFFAASSDPTMRGYESQTPGWTVLLSECKVIYLYVKRPTSYGTPPPPQETTRATTSTQTGPTTLTTTTQGAGAGTSTTTTIATTRVTTQQQTTVATTRVTTQTSQGRPTITFATGTSGNPQFTQTSTNGPVSAETSKDSDNSMIIILAVVVGCSALALISICLIVRRFAGDSAERSSFVARSPRHVRVAGNYVRRTLNRANSRFSNLSWDSVSWGYRYRRRTHVAEAGTGGGTGSTTPTSLR